MAVDITIATTIAGTGIPIVATTAVTAIAGAFGSGSGPALDPAGDLSAGAIPTGGITGKTGPILNVVEIRQRTSSRPAQTLK
jgi:hypothetical protein